MKRKRDELAEALTVLEKQANKHKETLRQFDSKRKAHQEKLEKLEEQVEQQKSEVEKLHSRAEDRKKKDQELKNTLDTFVQELENMPSNEEVDEQIQDLNKKLKNLKLKPTSSITPSPK